MSAFGADVAAYSTAVGPSLDREIRLPGTSVGHRASIPPPECKRLQCYGRFGKRSSQKGLLAFCVLQEFVMVRRAVHPAGARAETRCTRQFEDAGLGVPEESRRPTHVRAGITCRGSDRALPRHHVLAICLVSRAQMRSQAGPPQPPLRNAAIAAGSSNTRLP
jgi:hypothetical protein